MRISVPIRTIRALRSAAAMVGVAGALACCGPSTRAGGFDAANPSARLDAIDDAIRQWRASQTLPPLATRQGLVESLRSDDDLVRFDAIGALREMTGSDRGYVYSDQPALRRLAIERWVPWASAAGESPTAGAASEQTSHPQEPSR
ncbi:MAG: hypothetical protein SGJ09_00910 [Phycisphaerae bacterium]|nr:hypothetical protein [Phycisphaerae bacterium]